jgi:hypothetical protein
MTSLTRSRFLAPLLAAFAAAVAIGTAPAAHASAAQCSERGAAKLCQRPGHSSLYSEPRVSFPSGALFGGAWMPGFGMNSGPALMAVD